MISPTAPQPLEMSPSIPAISLRWVIFLRWWAVFGQAMTVAAAARALSLPVPVRPLCAVIGLAVVTNTLLEAWMRKPREVRPIVLAGVLAYDTLSLYVLLYMTGGPSNPFSVLFLVQIALAALVLGLTYASAITVLSTLAYALLFVKNQPVAGMGMDHMHHSSGTSAFDVHLQGMFVAFLLAAVLLTYFMTRLSLALRKREHELAAAERRAAVNEKLASLSTLAAGAAHELGTPLATIAVAAKELERFAAKAKGTWSGAESLHDDARLIREEVQRCSDIVQQMSARAGETMGEAPQRIDARAVAEDLKRALDEGRARRLDISTDDLSFCLPPRGLLQVLGTLVKNAFEASDEAGRVRFSVERTPSAARFIIGDDGAGMTASELAHVGEPFFTTKPPGAGMGLGVFLARAFADRLGGQLILSSERGRGTRAILELPSAESEP